MRTYAQERKPKRPVSRKERTKGAARKPAASHPLEGGGKKLSKPDGRISRSRKGGTFGVGKKKKYFLLGTEISPKCAKQPEKRGERAACPASSLSSCALGRKEREMLEKVRRAVSRPCISRRWSRSSPGKKKEESFASGAVVGPKRERERESERRGGRNEEGPSIHLISKKEGGGEGEKK